MERNEQVKQILFNGAEPVSQGFTESVMQRVKALSDEPLYPPLVSVRIKKLFLASFAALTTLILVVCLTMTFSYSLITNWLQRIKLPEINYFNILFFIGSFWIVFAANALAQKKVLTGKASF